MDGNRNSAEEDTSGHELLGSTRRATTADTTEPTEKKTESAVTRYCFSLGNCSRRRVPSVGIDPWASVSRLRTERMSVLTPTELPRKNKVTHNMPKELDKEARKPKTAVKKSVALNAVLRPIRSEP